MNRTIFLRKLKYNLRFLPDCFYLQLYYFFIFKKFFSLKNPKAYSEKLNWLKLKFYDESYHKLVDKFAVKAYVGNLIGEQFVIPTLGVWNSFDDIDFDELPQCFVLKCTHDSAGVIIVHDKESLDINKTRNHINELLSYEFHHFAREWVYKGIRPRIIAEQYIVDSNCNDLLDYKFFCFNGEVKIISVYCDRTINQTKRRFFDIDFNPIDIKDNNYHGEVIINKPKCFELMLDIATKLSQNTPHVRVDLYEVNGRVYFGEFTFFHHGGFGKFDPIEYDYRIGDWLKLP